jgi:hypothetical protein
VVARPGQRNGFAAFEQASLSVMISNVFIFAV